MSACTSRKLKPPTHIGKNLLAKDQTLNRGVRMSNHQAIPMFSIQCESWGLWVSSVLLQRLSPIQCYKKIKKNPSATVGAKKSEFKASVFPEHVLLMGEVGVGSWNLFKIFNFVGHMARVHVLIFTRDPSNSTRDPYNSTQFMWNPPKFNLVHMRLTKIAPNLCGTQQNWLLRNFKY